MTLPEAARQIMVFAEKHGHTNLMDTAALRLLKYPFEEVMRELPSHLTFHWVGRSLLIRGISIDIPLIINSRPSSMKDGGKHIIRRAYHLRLMLAATLKPDNY